MSNQIYNLVPYFTKITKRQLGSPSQFYIFNSVTAYDSFWLPPGLSSSQELRSACFLLLYLVGKENSCDCVDQVSKHQEQEVKYSLRKSGEKTKWYILQIIKYQLYILNYKRLCLSVRHVMSFHHFSFKCPQPVQWYWYKHIITPSKCSNSELNI